MLTNNWPEVRQLAWQSTRESFRKIALLGTVIGAIVAATVSSLDSVYRTTWTLLLPGTERSSTVNLDNIGEARTTTRNAYGNVSLSPKHTYREIALSNTVLDQAAQAFQVPTGSFSKPRLTLVQQTSAIKFTLKGADADKLRQRAKIFNDAFHDVLDQLRANEIERQNRGISQQLEDAKQRLHEAQQRIVDFKAEARLIADEQLPLKVQTLEGLRATLLNGETALARHRQNRQQWSALFGLQPEQAAAIGALSAHPKVPGLLAHYQGASTELTAMIATTGRDYPRRRLLQAEVDATLSELLSLRAQNPTLIGIDTNLFLQLLDAGRQINFKQLIDEHVQVSGLESEQNQLRDQIDVLSGELQDYTGDVAELDALQRDYQIAEAIFSSALTRLDSGKFDIYATYPLTQLLTQPGDSLVRDHLATKLILVAAALVFLLAALLLVLYRLRRHLQTSMRNTQRTSDA